MRDPKQRPSACFTSHARSAAWAIAPEEAVERRRRLVQPVQVPQRRHQGLRACWAGAACRAGPALPAACAATSGAPGALAAKPAAAASCAASASSFGSVVMPPSAARGERRLGLSKAAGVTRRPCGALRYADSAHSGLLGEGPGEPCCMLRGGQWTCKRAASSTDVSARAWQRSVHARLPSPPAGPCPDQGSWQRAPVRSPPP